MINNLEKLINKLLEVPYDFSIEYSTENGIKIKEVVSGDSGGSYNGERASSYRVEDSELKNNLFSSLKHIFLYYEKYLKEDYETTLFSIVENNQYKSIAEYSDYSDYYGNGDNYELFLFNTKEIMKKILLEEYYIEFEELYDKKFNELEIETTITLKKERLETLNQKYKNIDKDMSEELKKLKNNKESLLNQLKIIDKKIEDFNKDKIKRTKMIKEEIESINDFLTHVSKENEPKEQFKNKKKFK